MNYIVTASRFLFVFAFLVLSLLQNIPAYAYTIGEADGQLNRAARQLINPNRARPLPRNRCTAADMLLDQADVSIDQILRNRTMKGCLTQPLNDLEGRALRLRNLGRILQRECGMRRSYGNTLTKVRSWQNTKQCGAPNNQQRCKQYANTAVNQHQININKKCGFTGRAWSNNYTGHYNWCLSASENAAHQETQARKISIDNCAVPGECNRFIGTWQWFNGISVVISGNYRVSTSGNSGTWRCLPNGKIEIRWKTGGWIDTLSLNPDGHSLTGRNQHGTIVSASRHQAMLYDVQTPPYGGGRLCLTAEEAKKLKNAPNTVSFKPVGKSCSK